MAKLTKDAVLAADDVATEWFEVPEWGGDVPLRALDAWSQSKYTNSLMVVTMEGDKPTTTPNLEGAAVKLAALGIADEGGPWFTVEELGRKSSAVVNRIAERIRELSGMGEDALEEAEGN